MTQELAPTFVSRTISLEKREYSSQQKEEQLLIIKELFLKINKGHEIFIRDKDPLRFILTFLTAIDQGHMPIALPSDLPEFQLKNLIASRGNPTVIDNMELTLGSSVTEHKNCYGSLTSGTTGTPKLAILDIGNAKECAKAHAKSLEILRSDTVVQSLPLYHSFGIIAYIFTTLEIGCTLNLNRAFLGLRALKKRVLENGVIHLSPSQLAFIAKEKVTDLNCLKTISVGGGLVDSLLLSKVSELLPNASIYTTYGLTEAGPRVTTGEWNSAIKTGFIGRAIFGVTLLVIKDGELLKEGIGNLCIKTPYLKKNSDESELTNGYFITRDRVELNSKGEVYFLSREDDLINVGGISIYPKDIEEVVRTHSAVKDCIVLKEKCDEYEEYPVLVTEGTVSSSELDEYLKHKLTLVQMPKKTYCLDEFPRFSLGKINRKELLARLSL